MASHNAVKYSIVTFGCRVNQADSLGFEEELRRSGAAAAPPEDADLVVVNTCSVTAAADQGARQTIRRIARSNPDARIVVTGCYATRRPEEVAALPQCRSRRAERRQVATGSTSGFGDRLNATVRRRRGKLRRAHRARRRRPDRVHAARADRLRRTVLVLHHPDRPEACRGACQSRRCPERSRARDRRPASRRSP